LKITVKLGAPLSLVVGESTVQLHMPEDSTLADVLDALRTRFPDFEAGLKGKGLRSPVDNVLYTLFVDAKPVPFDQAQNTKLRDGNRVYLFLPVAGG
jgi:molybdopterin converting factor small subunit